MASRISDVRTFNMQNKRVKIVKKDKIEIEEQNMMTGEDQQGKDDTGQVGQPEPTVQGDPMDFNDLDFVDHYSEDKLSNDSQLLPENTAISAISCGFVGVGGGGGKLAKAFLDLGFNRTLLVNTTHKDQPAGLAPNNFLLLEGADGVGKDVEMGKQILLDNATLVEDTLRARLGKVDWLFVCASGGGGTGSSVKTLDTAFQRYLDSVQGSGKVVYLISTPTSQELLNPTIKSNSKLLLNDVKDSSHVVIDNEKQLQLLRGKVGLINMYPAANSAFSKMLSQVLKLASESTPIQTFDTKDLERCLRTTGRIFLGTVAVRNCDDDKLGLKIYRGCSERSPCPAPAGVPKAGVLLMVAGTDTVSDPNASNQMESAVSYVGGRSQTLFSGIYVRNGLPGLISIMMLCGL